MRVFIAMSDVERRLSKDVVVKIVGPSFRGSEELVGMFGQVVQSVRGGGLPTHELRTTYDPGKPGYQVDTGDGIDNFPDDSLEISVVGRGSIPTTVDLG